MFCDAALIHCEWWVDHTSGDVMVQQWVFHFHLKDCWPVTCLVCCSDTVLMFHFHLKDCWPVTCVVCCFGTV